MTDLVIEGADRTPSIQCLFALANIKLAGKSYPENTGKFYAPLMEWINQFFSTENTLTVDIELIYFNSSTSKFMLDLFESLEDFADDDGKNITVNWRYDEDNETMLEYGEEFEEDIEHIQFNLISL